MEDGILTMAVVEGIGLLCPYQISAVSMNPPTVTWGKEIGSATGGKIYVANYAKLSAIQPLTILNFNTMDMDNNLVQIWQRVMSPQ